MGARRPSRKFGVGSTSPDLSPWVAADPRIAAQGNVYCDDLDPPICYPALSERLNDMALSLRQVIPIGVSLCVLAAPAIGQSGGALPNAGQSPESREARLSPECRVPASQLYNLAPLQRVRTGRGWRLRARIRPARRRCR